jgi:hypothetical protein
MRMIILGILSLSLSLAQANVAPATKYIQVETFNQLRVGDSIRSLTEISHERTRWGVARRTAHFYFYLLSNDLPTRCLNLQCGRFAMRILTRNGFLVGGADREFAKEVGLEYGTSPESSPSLLIVTDSRGKVTALYENVTPASLGEIADALLSDDQ